MSKRDRPQPRDGPVIGYFRSTTYHFLRNHPMPVQRCSCPRPRQRLQAEPEAARAKTAGPGATPHPHTAGRALLACERGINLLAPSGQAALVEPRGRTAADGCLLPNLQVVRGVSVDWSHG